jgi:hypothetical protein
MAQTKTRAASKRSAGSKKPQARSRGSTSKSKSTNSQKRSSSPPPAPMAAMSNATEKATAAVGNAADKAKVPLVAGGAALAGMAGGVVLGTRRAHRHSRMDRAIKLAHELQQVRRPANGNRSRSPLEVVLEGLTARRSRA